MKLLITMPLLGTRLSDIVRGRGNAARFIGQSTTDIAEEIAEFEVFAQKLNVEEAEGALKVIKNGIYRLRKAERVLKVHLDGLKGK